MVEIFLGTMLNGQPNYDAISKCSKNVHPLTISAIIETESGFNPYAIGVNSGKRLSKQPSSLDEAISVATSLLEQGHNIDLGLGQINSVNLDWLDLSLNDVFDPCKNISAIDYVLSYNYERVYDETLNYDLNLKKALSMYNTGNSNKGFSNGYVAKVDAKAINQLKNIPLGADTEVTVTVVTEEPKIISKPLEVDAVDSFKSYGKKSINKHGDKDNTRERSEHFDDIQQD